jgi:hypothetical protein
MAKQIVQSFAIHNFLGQQTSPGVALPVGSTSVVADFDGTNMTDPAQRSTLIVEYAPNGTQYTEMTRSTFSSGALDRAGQPRDIYPVATDWVNQFGPSTNASRIRGTLIVENVPLTTTVHLTVA